MCQIATTMHNIRQNVRWEPMNSFLNHIQTHDIQRVPMLQQRLIDTKAIAKNHLPLIPNQSSHSPFLPASQCMVIHQNSTIHGRYNSAYREAVTLPPIFDYLQRKHSWDETTHSTIHWTWFQKAIKRPQPSSRTNITKLIYNQLATQQRKADDNE